MVQCYMTHPKGNNVKVNVIEQHKLEHAHFEVKLLHVGHDATMTYSMETRIVLDMTLNI